MNSNISVTEQYIHIQIEFQNSIEGLSFLCRKTDIKVQNCLDKSLLDTASYRLAKCLAKNLPPLEQSTYTIKSTSNFMGKIKNERIYLDFAMVSFDVKSLFTSVSLTKTIDIILDRVYNRKKKTVLTKNKIKKLVSLVSTYISH